MYILSLYLPKGGVGKTSTAANLAAGMVKRGRRVVVVDLDHQAHLSRWMRADPDHPGLFQAITGDAPLASCVQSTPWGVDLIAADGTLAGAEPVLRTAMGGENWLRRELGRLPHRWDVCLLDSGPALGVLAVGALAASNGVLAPCEPAVLATQGLQDLLGLVEQARETINDRLQILGVVPVKVDARLTMGASILEEMNAELGDLMLPMIRTDAKLIECPISGQSIFEYAPRSRGAADYSTLTDEVLARVEKAQT